MEPGHRIKELRDELKLSQQELADRANAKQEAIGRTERNRRNKHVEYWIRLARGLGKTVEEVYYLPEKIT